MKDKVAQIKVYENTNRSVLEMNTNDFLKQIGIGDIIDIKYQFCSGTIPVYSVMIIYKKALGITIGDTQYGA